MNIQPRGIHIVMLSNSSVMSAISTPFSVKDILNLTDPTVELDPQGLFFRSPDFDKILFDDSCSSTGLGMESTVLQLDKQHGTSPPPSCSSNNSALDLEISSTLTSLPSISSNNSVLLTTPSSINQHHLSLPPVTSLQQLKDYTNIGNGPSPTTLSCSSYANGYHTQPLTSPHVQSLSHLCPPYPICNNEETGFRGDATSCMIQGIQDDSHGDKCEYGLILKCRKSCLVWHT